jgi:hypothetical protein
MGENAPRVDKVELVVKTAACFCDRGRVRQHANCLLNLRNVTWKNWWRLAIDADLETGRAPISKLDRTLRFHRRN